MPGQGGYMGQQSPTPWWETGMSAGQRNNYLNQINQANNQQMQESNYQWAIDQGIDEDRARRAAFGGFPSAGGSGLGYAQQQGNELARMRQELERMQMAGASPDRILGAQQAYENAMRQAQQWLAQQRGRVMNPGLGSMGNNMPGGGGGISFGQQNLWEQIIAALGLGGGGGASTPMG